MFWGTIIKEGKPYKSAQAFQGKDTPAFHISNVSLGKNAPNEKVYLVASGDKEFNNLTVATLQKDKIENLHLDLYVHMSDTVSFKVEGKAELHLSGYYEHRAELDDDAFMNPDELEEDDEEDDDQIKKITENLKAAKANSAKNAKLLEAEDSDEDEEGESEDDEEYL